MAFIPTPNAARVAITTVSNLHPMVNTLWFRKTTPYTASDLGQLVSEIESWWGTQVMPLLCSQTGFTQVYALDASSESGPVATLVVSPVVFGGEADTPMTLNSAMTVTFQTAKRGRSARGRVYLGGWGEDAATAATFAAGFLTDVVSAFENLPSYLTVSESVHVVASHYTDGAPRVTGVTEPVINYRANSTVYSQRNRTR